MPGLDHRGPEGEGPRTGRQMGNCKPAANQEEENLQDLPRGRGLGRGPGRGRGRGFRRRTN